MDVVRIDRPGDRVAVVTIDRPSRRNALSPEVMCRLCDAWDLLDADPAVGAVVVTGAGDQAFSAGADLELLIPLLAGTRQPADDWDRRIVEQASTVTDALLKSRQLSKPLIAAVNGAAVAGGFELVLATDLRVAAPHAAFGLAEVRRGLVPAGGGVVRLSRQLPRAVALELLLTGDTVDAATALAHGLVNRVVPAGDVLGEALALADRIAANGPLAVQAIRRIVHEVDGTPLAEAFRVEGRHAREVTASADALEGARAFLERRPPRFQGR